jgi:hypothetical protein
MIELKLFFIIPAKEQLQFEVIKNLDPTFEISNMMPTSSKLSSSSTGVTHANNNCDTNAITLDY